MPTEFRITLDLMRVLREFLADPTRPRYGYDLMESTGFPSGKLYPMVAKLTKAGWLIRTAEDIDPAQEGRPARYMYVLSDEGMQAARQELAALQLQLSFPGRPLRLQTEGGLA